MLTPLCRLGKKFALPGCRTTVTPNSRFAPRSAFERVIGQELAPYLQSVGFLRHGQTLNRHAKGVVQVISVQRSMNNTELDSRFTVNIGYPRHPTGKGQGGRIRMPGSPAHRLSAPGAAGSLVPLSAERHGEQLAVAEARADIEVYVLPYLSQKSGDFPSLLLRTTSAMQAHVKVWKAFNRLSRRIIRLWLSKRAPGR